jgi:hypothetical protein
MSDLQDLDVELAVHTVCTSQISIGASLIYTGTVPAPSADAFIYIPVSLAIEIRSISASECVHVRLAVGAGKEA